MQRTKFALEFKDEAVKQVIDKGHTVVDVAKRLGIPDNVLYTWVSKFKKQTNPNPVTSRRCKPRWQSSRPNSGEPLECRREPAVVATGQQPAVKVRVDHAALPGTGASAGSSPARRSACQKFGVIGCCTMLTASCHSR
jgi:transposase-like protein